MSSRSLAKEICRKGSRLQQQKQGIQSLSIHESHCGTAATKTLSKTFLLLAGSKVFISVCPKAGQGFHPEICTSLATSGILGSLKLLWCSIQLGILGTSHAAEQDM